MTYEFIIYSLVWGGKMTSCIIVGHRSNLCLPLNTNFFMLLAKRWFFCVCVVAKGLLYTTYTWRNLCQPIPLAHPFFNMRLRYTTQLEISCAYGDHDVVRIVFLRFQTLRVDPHYKTML
jgi:hypothetical protein